MLHNHTEDLSLKNAIDNALKLKNCQDFIKMLNDHYGDKSLDLIMIDEYTNLLGYIIYNCIEQLRYDKEGKTLVTALTMIEHVINMGANVNACANYHQNRKIEAHTPLTITLLSSYSKPDEIIPILTLLLKRGAKPDLCARDEDKFPILYVTDSALLQVLLEHKADPNLIYHKDSNSLSPLAFFILRKNHHSPNAFKNSDEDFETYKCLQLLIKYGADPLFCNRYQSRSANALAIAKIHHEKNSNDAVYNIVIELLESSMRNPVKVIQNLYTENVPTLFSAPPSPIKEVKVQAEVDNDSDDDSDDGLRDPITLERMKDPITLDCGHAFDRESLSDFYNSNKPNCHSCPICQEPITRPPETHKTSIALKKAIEKKTSVDIKMRK
jgi:hypothetical protein